PGYAAEVELESLLAELKQAAAQTVTLSSPFEQEKYLDIFAEKLLSQGQFTYRKPDQLRWELLTPVASGFVLRGERGERWNRLSQEQEKFSITSDPIMGMIAQQLLAWARVDLDWLQERYRIELQGVEPVTLHLYPLAKGEAEYIDYLQIEFAPDRSHVVVVQMVEPGGDSTTIRFTDVVINSELITTAFQVPE
ncbi:MAG: outer membrane lipoprotein carrier protein LolA, partial [Desulfuromonadales bacterium]|nr:outer membrane lipoprotein carrier protein LolA [Desulfuromonadales bacterium]